MIGINDACEILSWAYNNNIEIWLDGGWGVDALLGKETRQHNDIDLFVEEKNYNKFIEIIKNKGFNEIVQVKCILFGLIINYELLIYTCLKITVMEPYVMKAKFFKKIYSMVLEK